MKLSLGKVEKKVEIRYSIPEWFPDRVKEFLRSGKATDLGAIIDEEPPLPERDSLIYWWVSLNQAKINYENLISVGWTVEQASIVLPTLSLKKDGKSK